MLIAALELEQSETEARLYLGDPTGQDVQRATEVWMLDLRVVVVSLEGREIHRVEEVVEVDPKLEASPFAERWQLR